MLVRCHHGFAAKTPATAAAAAVFRSRLVFVLALLALLCPPSRVSAQTASERQLPAQVLQDLLDRHGDNGTISVTQLRALLVLLSQPQGEEEAAGGSDAAAGGGGGDLQIQEAPATTAPSLNGSKVKQPKPRLPMPVVSSFIDTHYCFKT